MNSSTKPSRAVARLRGVNDIPLPDGLDGAQPPPRFMRAENCCEHIGVTFRTLWRLVAEGVVPRVKFGRHCTLFPVAEADAAILARAVTTTAEREATFARERAARAAAKTEGGAK